jgi:hypothetical protein
MTSRSGGDNARINPTADEITQGKSCHPSLMKAKLRRVGLNELLDGVVTFI